MAEEIKKQEKAADDKKSEAAPKKVKKKAKKRHLIEANVCIQVSFNNTIVTVTDMKGDTVCWSSSGSCGFKGTRKATPYAASVAVENALTKAKAMGVEKVHVTMKGTGAGRDQSLRAINATEVSIESISDITAIAHNGCRARKARRI
ncbi:MAG: 30S ribosomal protein S11 [Patescibacteria group bacterium]